MLAAFREAEETPRPRRASTRAAARRGASPHPDPNAPAERLLDLQSLLEAELAHPERWRPQERPAALPCFLTAYHQGRPALGTAVLDADTPFDAEIPLEVVPAAEAQRCARRLLTRGGHFIFSDDYVRRHPESRVAQMVGAFAQRRCGERLSEEDGGEIKTRTGLFVAKAAAGAVGAAEDTDGLSSAGVSTTTAASSLPSALSSVTSAPKSKKEQVRDCIQEVVAASRPIFRRRDACGVYGTAAYVKRNFHEIMDQEYPIEYII